MSVIHVDALVRLLASLPAGGAPRPRRRMRRAFPRLRDRPGDDHAGARLPLERGRGDPLALRPLLDDIAPWVREILASPSRTTRRRIWCALDGGDWLLLDPQLPPVPLPLLAGR